MERKKTWIILGVLLILLLGVGVSLYFVFFKKEIVLKSDDTLELNEKVTIQDIIEEDMGYEIINGSDVIDTSQVTKKEVVIKYKNRWKEEEKTIEISIQDTTPPEITFQKEVEVNVGKEIDLLKDVKVRDNSEEEIKVEVEGKYDIKTVGEYTLEYVAKDSSGNITREEFVLKVKGANTEKPSSPITAKDYQKISVPTGKKEEVGKTKKGYTIYQIDGSYYIDGLLIANKTYPLKDGFVPENTYTSAVGITSQCASCINNTAYEAWIDLEREARSKGLNIWIQSGYRPQSLQVELYNSYVNRDGKAAADTYSSRPGHSEHQTGLCFDLNSITDAFQYTEEGRWINDNAHRYGFIIRFPKGKESETGYQYESWHLRYVGTELSYKLYNNGNWISLEDYLGITSVYEED